MAHWLAVGAYWFVLLGLAGEFSTEQGQNNPTLPFLFLLWVAFGVYRVVRKIRARRSEARGRALEPEDTQSRSPSREVLAATSPAHEEDKGAKSCPGCAETIAANAKVCRFCGYRYQVCPDCAELSEREAKVCRHCGYHFKQLPPVSTGPSGQTVG